MSDTYIVVDDDGFRPGDRGDGTGSAWRQCASASGEWRKAVDREHTGRRHGGQRPGPGDPGFVTRKLLHFPDNRPPHSRVLIDAGRRKREKP
jgi:hypothetical protein